MNEIDILSSTYFDIATIKGKRKLKDSNTGVTKFEEVITYNHIKCAVSKVDNQNLTSGDIKGVDYTHLLFATPDIRINPGDIVEITFENGLKSNFTAGKPFYYCSHLEVYLNVEERV